MIQQIEIQKALELENKVFVDTRSPAEFEEDHILMGTTSRIKKRKKRFY